MSGLLASSPPSPKAFTNTQSSHITPSSIWLVLCCVLVYSKHGKMGVTSGIFVTPSTTTTLVQLALTSSGLGSKWLILTLFNFNFNYLILTLFNSQETFKYLQIHKKLSKCTNRTCIYCNPKK